MESRLVSAQNQAATTSSYLFDPTGARKQSTVGTAATWFFEDGGQEIAEYTSAWANLIEFVRGPGNEIVASVTYPSGLTPAGDITYYHNDPLGSPLAVTHAGAVTNIYAYGPFGETNPLAGPACLANARAFRTDQPSRLCGMTPISVAPASPPPHRAQPPKARQSRLS